jgi:hypothetical protein
MEQIDSSHFDHFIITRFNLKNDDWSVDKNNNTICDSDWLSFRFDIFKKTCFNSIKNQSTKNFNWLVYFDTETPKFYKEVIDNLHIEFPFVIPIFKKSNQDFLNDLGDDIKSLTNKEYIITTRIDNDDALHYRAIEKIQEQFNYQDSTIINLPWIVCFDLINKKMSKHFYVSNPFISLIEKKSINTYQTVFIKQHNDWRKSHPIININDEQAYCFQLIHDRNICNQMAGSLIYDKNIVNDFNLMIDLTTGFSYPLKVVFFRFRLILQKIINLFIKIIRKIIK